ncbi:hypothetical protein XANCAGTX0491_004396 [Xanthoria calcicola]
MAISSLVAANIAVKPLQAFFNSDELKADAAMRQEISGSQTSEPVIKVHKVAFSWTRKMEQPSLQIERFEANAGSFCCIIGGVGSGKSTFLQPQFSARVRNSKAPSNDPETVVSSLGPSRGVNTPQRASWRAYLDYARTTTLPGLVIYFTSLIGSQFASAGSRIWIKVWADSNQRNGAYGNVAMYIGVYFAFGVGSAMARAVEELCLYILCGLVAARNLHEDLAKGVLGSPMSFFETTASGKILNRFTSDTYQIDEVIAPIFGIFISRISGTLIALVVISPGRFEIFVAIQRCVKPVPIVG